MLKPSQLSRCWKGCTRLGYSTYCTVQVNRFQKEELRQTTVHTYCTDSRKHQPLQYVRTRNRLSARNRAISDRFDTQSVSQSVSQ